MSINSLHKKYISLWTLAHKFSGGNSKITTQIEEYISTNFLKDTFKYQTQSGETFILPVFILAAPRKGRQTPYFNPAALEVFEQERGEAIKQKAKEFEEACPTINLRLLRRQLNIAPALEKGLLQFIESNCLQDTFESTDEQGNTTQELIFDYPIDNHSKAYLCIQKKGILTFIKKHKEELEAIGAKNLSALIQNIPSFQRNEGYLQKSDLFQLLHIACQNRRLFNKLFDSTLRFQTKTITDEKGNETTVPLFVKRKSRQKTVYCIHKKDIPFLIKQNEEALRQVGLPTAIIDHFYQTKKIKKRTAEMISFRMFSDNYLHSRKISALIHEIKKNHLNDSYLTYDEHNNPVQKSVFVKVKACNDETKNYVFRNKEALLAFLKENKELLFQYGITQTRFDNIFKEEESVIPDGEHILISDLSEKYHFIGREQLPKLPEYIKETFTSYNQNGEPVEKPLVFVKRENNSGYLKYYVLRDAVLPLLTRHKDDLKIQENTFKAIQHNMPILIRKDSMITMENLADVFGMSTYSYRHFTKLIENACLKDKHMNPQTKQEENTFVYAMSLSGKICLMMESAGLEKFIHTHVKDLIRLGAKTQNIYKALSTAKFDPMFFQRFVIKRQKNQEKYRRLYHLRKEQQRQQQ